MTLESWRRNSWCNRSLRIFRERGFPSVIATPQSMSVMAMLHPLSFGDTNQLRGFHWFAPRVPAVLNRPNRQRYDVPSASIRRTPVHTRKGATMKTTLRSGWLSHTLARAQAAPMIAIAFLTLATYQASGQTYTTLHGFTGKSDGGYALAPVILDSKGNLYGTTFQGGDMNCAPGQGCGTVFKVDPSGKETVFYAFKSPGPDGAFPAAGLVRDASGNLFGTTTLGGAGGIGTVFEVSASGHERLLYSFKGNKLGAYPSGAIVRDPAGNIYGTGRLGDSNCDPAYSGCGIVFKLTSAGKFTVLHTFHNIGKDGNIRRACSAAIRVTYTALHCWAEI